MSQEVQQEAIENDIKAVFDDVKKIAKKFGLTWFELLPVLTHREILIVNRQLAEIHEHLNWIHDKLKSKEEK